LAKVSSVESVGEFALGVAIAAPIFTFANLQLRSVQATDSLHQNSFGHYLGLRLTSTPIALCLIVSILFLANYSMVTASVVLMVAIGRAIESISDVIYGELQCRERLDWIACSMILKSVLSVVTIAGTVAMTGSLIAGLSAMCGVWLAILALYDLPRVMLLLNQPDCGLLSANGRPQSFGWTKVLPSFDIVRISKLFALALPLGFVMMLSSLNAHIPRYFIEQRFGRAELGIYASISAIFSGLYFFQIALGHAVLPRLARHYASGERRDYLKFVGVVLAFGMANGLLAILVAKFGGGDLLRSLFSDEFAHADSLFLWLAVASIAQCLNGALAYFLHAARQFKQTAWATAISTFAIFGCSAAFIPRWGVVGGAYAILAGSLLSIAVLSVQFAFLMRTFKEDRNAI
jgi:O-antigen/teichoic acid export membrane protein